MSASKIRLDLNSPALQDVFFRLAAAELKPVVASLERLRALEWNAFDHTGYQWEHVNHLKGPGGVNVYSLRLTQRVRAIGYRDGDFLRLVLLPDHDSAYDRRSVPIGWQAKRPLFLSHYARARTGGPG